MGQALYRKYRTRTFAETLGQEHVTKTLENAIKQGKISHAYLLTGPRGVGKTSIARILAHEVNGLPYTGEQHLDIIEIDAASNSSVEDIRDLRDKVNISPTSAKYKVYIIDEVHMLSKSAFNALLKTLEEPPQHVIFILATTEAHKLPETIISRTQRYSLRPVPLGQVVGHLRQIAAGEKVKIDDDALELIAKHGEGSFRDSISLLDQASAIADEVKLADVERILGLAPGEYISHLQTALSTGDNSTVVTVLDELYQQGYEPAMVAQQISAILRETVLTSGDPATLELLRKLLDVSSARQPKQLLEIILLQAATKTGGKSIATPVSTPTKIAEASASPTPVAQAEPDSKPKIEIEIVPDVLPDTTDNVQQLTGIENAEELWQQVLDNIKKQHNTLYGIARMATPQLLDDQIILGFKFQFHQKRLSEVKNRKILADVIEEIVGRPIKIECKLVEKTEPTAPADISAISNIFGDGVVVE